jgi:hypothetical protein
MATAMGNTAESDLLTLLFQNTNWANLGDATGLRGSTTAGSFFIGLSTGTLSGSSTQTTTEAAYTSYARVAVARSSGGWTISGSAPTSSKNAAAVTFPAATGGSETETYAVIGRDTSGAGEVIFWGALTSSLAVSSGITPSFAINALVATMT